jgi:thiol-disulfide isomerase/thioredoxin
VVLFVLVTTTRVLLLAGLIVVALLLGWLRRRTDGRARAGRGAVLAAADLGQALGSRATLVQFSTVVCAPCRVTRRVLADIADIIPGVRHVELDAEQRVDLTRRLGILRAPTVLVLDRSGREVARTTGVPTSETITRTLDTLDRQRA